VLRVEACGICGTDVEQCDGVFGTEYLPIVPGHEPVGIIEEIAPRVSDLWAVKVGDRVGVEAQISCRFVTNALPASTYIANVKSMFTARIRPNEA
jgi:D-arabinose 1-dehydrogenase-like Zn-dependent alcohol dehydrogenase